ncbi:AlbA family DNA-binding domain-containing protein [Streptomyces sp. INA 01156]
MTLNFEADEPVVGLARQRELIQAVLDASSADETRWLEWKSRLDLSKAEGAFAVSKAILGFANRMPDVAEQWAEGHAYLLVGVEENVVHGVAKYDSTEIDAWLGRYLGDFGRYQPTYVPFDNGEGPRDVLLIDVFPTMGRPHPPSPQEPPELLPGHDLPPVCRQDPTRSRSRDRRPDPPSPACSQACQRGRGTHRRYRRFAGFH